jgi:hypothetical protein
MMSKKRYWLLALAVIAMALIAIGSRRVRIIVVDEFTVADSSVRKWLEEIVEKEKANPYRNNKVVMDIYTTRNSIIAGSYDSRDLPGKIVGLLEVEGGELIIVDNELEGAAAAFEKTGKKVVRINLEGIGASFLLEDALRGQKFNSNSYYYKFIDGEWVVSTWEETSGEQIREEYEQWLLEHPDTLELKPAMAPSFVERYDSLTGKNIHPFIKEWKGWSSQLQEYSADSLVNEAIRRIYAEYLDTNKDDSCALFVLPGSIEVRGYSGAYDEYKYEDVYLVDDREWEYMMKASQRYAYTPNIDTDKAVVYITREIQDLLSQYLEVNCRRDGSNSTDWSKWSEINDGRVAELRHYIPVVEGHWEGWHFCTMPWIFAIYLHDDGYIADMRTSWRTGEVVFFPYEMNKEKRILASWEE